MLPKIIRMTGQYLPSFLRPLSKVAINRAREANVFGLAPKWSNNIIIKRSQGVFCQQVTVAYYLTVHSVGARLSRTFYAQCQPGSSYVWAPYQAMMRMGWCWQKNPPTIHAMKMHGCVYCRG